MDPAIRDDLHGTVREKYVDQHSAVVLGVPDPQLGEQVDRALAR